MRLHPRDGEWSARGTSEGSACRSARARGAPTSARRGRWKKECHSPFLPRTASAIPAQSTGSRYLPDGSRERSLHFVTKSRRKTGNRPEHRGKGGWRGQIGGVEKRLCVIIITKTTKSRPIGRPERLSGSDSSLLISISCPRKRSILSTPRKWEEKATRERGERGNALPLVLASHPRPFSSPAFALLLQQLEEKSLTLTPSPRFRNNKSKQIQHKTPRASAPASTPAARRRRGRRARRGRSGEGRNQGRASPWIEPTPAGASGLVPVGSPAPAASPRGPQPAGRRRGEEIGGSASPAPPRGKGSRIALLRTTTAAGGGYGGGGGSGGSAAGAPPARRALLRGAPRALPAARAPARDADAAGPVQERRGGGARLSCGCRSCCFGAEGGGSAREGSRRGTAKEGTTPSSPSSTTTTRSSSSRTSSRAAEAVAK